MFNKTKNITLFAIGAAGYSCAEIIWRGWTHWSMAATGGLCALGIHLINSRSKQGFAVKTLESTALITGIEFAVGCIVNKLLHWSIWDYSEMPFNICGQICPQYIALWIPLAALALLVSGLFTEKKQEKDRIAFA